MNNFVVSELGLEPALIVFHEYLILFFALHYHAHGTPNLVHGPLQLFVLAGSCPCFCFCAPFKVDPVLLLLCYIVCVQGTVSFYVRRSC